MRRSYPDDGDAESTRNRCCDFSAYQVHRETIAMERPREGWKHDCTCDEDVPESHTGDSAKVGANDQRRNEEREP